MANCGSLPRGQHCILCPTYRRPLAPSLSRNVAQRHDIASAARLLREIPMPLVDRPSHCYGSHAGRIKPEQEYMSQQQSQTRRRRNTSPQAEADITIRGSTDHLTTLVRSDYGLTSHVSPRVASNSTPTLQNQRIVANNIVAPLHTRPRQTPVVADRVESRMAVRQAERRRGSYPATWSFEGRWGQLR